MLTISVLDEEQNILENSSESTIMTQNNLESDFKKAQDYLQPKINLIVDKDQGQEVEKFNPSKQTNSNQSKSIKKIFKDYQGYFKIFGIFGLHLGALLALKKFSYFLSPNK